MKNTTAIFLIVLSLGLFFVFTRPYYEGVKEVAATAQGYREAIDNLTQIIEMRDRLLVSYNSIPKTELDRLEKALPENVDTVKLAHELDSIGAKYGISITNVSIEAESSQEPSAIILPGFGESSHEKALVTVKFVSNYANFRQFLEDLEQSLRIMDVRSAKFEVGETNLYEHELLLETYWVK